MEKLLTTRQVADAMGLHIKTLQKRLRENNIALAYVQVSPRKIGFKPSELEKYFATHEIARDGSGVAKKAKRKVVPAARFMTDEEAQVFFAGVARNSDGDLLPNPES
jgi:hypothetical protein